MIEKNYFYKRLVSRLHIDVIFPLIHKPNFTVKDITRNTNATYLSIMLILRDMVDVGVLTMKKYPRHYEFNITEKGIRISKILEELRKEINR
jgi:predicted transcriptional regulator